MDFGRIPHFDQVDFTLPPDHRSVVKVLGGVKSPAPRFFIGGVRWASDSFPGVIYPLKAKPADYVKHYAQQFNTIELNTTHYGLPAKDTLRRWRDIAPDVFHFCPKLHQAISHAPNLTAMAGLCQENTSCLQLLEHKLGPIFMQLPPHFSIQRGEELQAFLEKTPAAQMALELRHETWFRRETELNAICNQLYKHHLGLVITDTPGRRDVLHMRLTNKTAFVRFNAHTGFEGDKLRIDAWMERAKRWLDLGLESFYFFVHTPQQLAMPGLVMYALQKLQDTCGVKLKAPLLYGQTGS